MQKILKTALPHFVAIIIFAAISTCMFYPQLSGRSLKQGDVVNYEGMSKDIEDAIAETGENPNWTGRMFGGMPAYTMKLDHGFQISSIIQFHDDSNSILMLFLAMTGFYIMLLLMGVNPYVAIIGGLAYGLSTYFPIIISAGHITKMWALQWVAPLIGSIWYAYRNKMWVGGALTAFFATLLISPGHHQITYYFLFVILSLIIAQFIMAYKEKMLKRFYKTSAILVVSAILAVGSNAAALYYVADYSKVSTRGTSELVHAEDANNDNKTSGLDRDYITAWSYGKAESFNLFIPNFVGGGRDFQEDGEVNKTLTSVQAPQGIYKQIPSYYGSQPFTEGPVYIGAVIIFLAIFALFLLPGAYKWWIIAPSLLALMLSWGHNFNLLTDLFIDYVPLYNKFRVPSMILVILEWSIPLLGALGLCKFYKMTSGLPITYIPKISTEKALLYTLYITGGFALFSALILPSVLDFTAPSDAQTGLPEQILMAMNSERADLLRSDSIRSLMLVLATAAILWGFLKGKIKKMTVMVAALIALVAYDLLSVDRRYVSPEDFMPAQQAKEIRMTDADKQILMDKSDFRVADFTYSGENPFNSSRASYFHRSIGGYHAAKMGKYQELIDAQLSKMNLKAYDMMNTKYYIAGAGVQLNNSAIGSAVLIDSVMWAENANEELELIGHVDFEPSRVAIVDKKWANVLEGVQLDAKIDSLDYIKIDSYSPARLEYTASSSQERLALFSEIYHSDWHVTINGEEVTPIAADYVLRGVVLPKGESKIVWEFKQHNRDLIMSVAGISTSLILLWIITIFALGIFKFIKTNKAE